MRLGRRVTGALILCLILGLALPGILMANDGPRVVIDGRELSFDVAPRIVSGRTMVPLRAIFEALGATIVWDDETRTVTAVRGQRTVQIQVGARQAFVSGQPVDLDQPAEIVDGRTLVPLRFVSEALGSQVGWDGASRTITITPAADTTPTPLAWPTDVGSSHLGIMGHSPGYLPFPGAWLRPHPGPFVWGGVEVRPGAYDWRRIDDQVQMWQSQRLAILATVWPFAAWDQEQCHGAKPRAQGTFPHFGTLLYSPCDPTSYAAWLTALVQRYDGNGRDDMPGLQYPIRHWEILNEPEMREINLTFFQGSPAEYQALLTLSARTVRAADPQAVILSGGQAGMDDLATRFWQPVLSGASAAFDIANVHSIKASDTFNAPAYRAFLNGLDLAAKPFWVTEALVGRMSYPPLSGDELARLTFTGYVNALAAGAQVIFNVGANDPTGGPGPASDYAFLVLAHTVGDFTAVQRLAPNAVRFDRPGGRQVFALWDGARLPDDVQGTVTVVPYAGDQSQQPATAVTGSIPVFAVVTP